jgi:septal ring factor EnvC (AmiA/AmiB activator)
MAEPFLTQLGLMAVGAAFGVCSGLVAFYLKDLRRAVREEQASLAEELSRLRREAARLEAALPEKYVLRDDFVRTVVGFEHRLDALRCEVAEVGKNISRLVGAEAA